MTDYIKRADAIEAIYKMGKSKTAFGELLAIGWVDVKQCLEALPSANAVQGEWIRKEKEENDCDGYRAWYWYECSVCGARPPKDTWKNEWHSDYCPSCGAYMTHKESE